MPRGGRVTVKDKGLTATITRLTKASFGATLQIGILGNEGAVLAKGVIEEPGKSANEAHGDDGLTVAELGEIHEFGLGVPQRSFIGAWSDEMEDEHREQIRKVAQAVVKGKLDSWEQGLERLGNLFVAQVQKRIADGIAPPLEEATSKAKGSTKPLVDTGVLKASITYKVIAKNTVP